MQTAVRRGHWLVTVFLCLALPAFTQDRPPISCIHTAEPAPAPVIGPDGLERLGTWLDRNSDLPRRASPPAVALTSPEKAGAILGAPSRGYGPARAFYDPDAATIHVVAPWSASNPRDLSVLLHELVHHRQIDHPCPCRGAAELVAYRAQAAWLSERGLSLDVNWLAIVLDARCTPRDIHPE